MAAERDAALDDALDRLTFSAPGDQADDGRGGAGRPTPLARLLVASDGSRGAAHALRWTADLARRLGPRGRARVRVVTALGVPRGSLLVMVDRPVGAPDVTEEQMGREVLGEAADALRGAGLEPDVATVRGTGAASAIVQEAASWRADLVVMGAHGRGVVSHALLGSVADAVSNRADAAILLARGDPPPRRLLLPTDGSRTSRRAVALGLDLAALWGVPAAVLHAVPPPEFRDPHAARRAFDAAAREVRLPSPAEGGVEFELRFGKPARVIVDHEWAAEGDLVVMGSTGRSGLGGLLLGSVSNRVAHEAAASVLLVKPERGP